MVHGSITERELTWNYGKDSNQTIAIKEREIKIKRIVIKT
jgi:hypothetical protein